MKKLLTVICSLFLAASVSGQQIKSRPAGFDDFCVLLEAAGYEMFSFDLTQLLEEKGRYDMTVSIREYESGKAIKTQNFPCESNKVLVTDFPEKSRGSIPQEKMADPVAGIYKQAEKLSIGFFPSGADSTKMLSISIPEIIEAKQQLKLRGVTSSNGVTLTRYRTRPFKIDSFESGKFIPLVFLGSMWYDAKSNRFRFCGEREIAPDLSSEIVGNVPHFYVIGVVFTKQ